MMIFFLLFFLLFTAPAAYAAPSDYDIVATYNDEERRIYGSERITFVNDGADPLSELYLFLYPNLYFQRDPDVDQSLYNKAYPTGFNPGEMMITSIQDADGKMLPFFPDFLKKRILMRIQLPAPIPPGGTFQFLVHFVTIIPEKWGVFGHYKNLVTLQGGWHPYLPPFLNGEWNFLLSPPKSNFRIRFTLGDRLELLASAPSKPIGEGIHNRTFLLEASDLPFFSLSIGKKIIRQDKKVDTVNVVYHALLRDKSYAAQVIKIAEEATAFFLKESGPVAPTHLQLAEAHLYQDLVTPGAKILYMNTRLFKVFTVLKRFHEASIVRGVFLLLWREKLPEEEMWVIEGLAYLDAERFMQEKYGNRSSMEQWLKPFAFIPLIDQILYSKDLPLRQIYFKESVSPILNEDLQFFNHPRPEGTMIFSKLTNLLGRQVVRLAVETYRNEIQLGGQSSFRQVLFRTSRNDLTWFFEQWLTMNPALDFGIEKIERRKTEAGHRTSIIVKKYGEGIEPLEIRVQERNGSQIRLVWDGREETHEEVLITPSPIETVELDPEKNSSDPNRLNNRDPQRWKILLNRYGIGYDFQTRVISYKAGLLFQRLYDDRNRYRIDLSHSDEGNALTLERTQTLRNNHVFSLGFSYERPETTEKNIQDAPAGYVHFAYALNYPDVPLFAGYVQRLTAIYPKFNISLNYNQQVIGGEYENSFFIGVDVRRNLAFSNFNELGTRLFVGQSFGALFENSRYFLGGDNGMRGYTPLAVEGQNKALVSLEYRFPIWYEADLNMAGLAHFHTFQGAVFADTGIVTDSHNIFKLRDYLFDAGAGMRFHIDFLGFYPIIVRVDVAVPIASPIEREQKPHFYLLAGQPF